MAHASAHPVQFLAFPAEGSGLTLAMLRARHTNVMMWFGEATRHYWAIIGGRLVEAMTLTGLETLLASPPSPSHPTSCPVPVVRGRAGTGSGPFQGVPNERGTDARRPAARA